MTPAEALRAAHDAGRTGRVFYWDHALDQMNNRHIRRADVKHALANALNALDAGVSKEPISTANH